MTIKLSKSQRHIDHESGTIDVSARRSKMLNCGRSGRHNDRSNDRIRSRSKQTASLQERGIGRPRTQTVPTSPLIDHTNLTLDVIHQPTKSVQLGVPIDVAVTLSLDVPSSHGQPQADTMDTSNLLATASLVAERCQGERVPLQTGFLTAPTLFDTVHPIQDVPLEPNASSQRCRTILGYLSFPDLLIRQAGTYRIRTTLMRMGCREEAGATCLVAVDSQPIKVERHGVAT